MPHTKEDVAAFVEKVVADFKAKFGDRAAIVVVAGIPEYGGHDGYWTQWSGPCLTVKGLIHHAVPELDRSVKFR